MATPQITLERVKELVRREQERYEAEHPKSKQMFEEARNNLVGGVPMSWMRIWVGGFPVFVEKAEGVHITDVDGHNYLDLCLGDTGGLCGHAHPRITEAIYEQIKNRGTTTMLPTEDSIWVGKELERRFKLPCWQILMTATDANRMALKAAREYTGRRLILAFNGTYHGSVDETLCVNIMGYLINAPGLMGPIVEDPSVMTRMIEFNDVDALEEALAPQDVACVITEPVLTNVGIIKPEPGYHDALRELTRKYGTLLLIDETHSMCAGPRGVTGEMDLDPDIFVVGKFIAGGYPAAALGFTREISDWMAARQPWHVFFGFGGDPLRQRHRRRRHPRRPGARPQRRQLQAHDKAGHQDGGGARRRHQGARAGVVRGPHRLPGRVPLPPPGPQKRRRGAIRRRALQRGGPYRGGPHRPPGGAHPSLLRQPRHPADPRS